MNKNSVILQAISWYWLDLITEVWNWNSNKRLHQLNNSVERMNKSNYMYA